MSFKSSTKKLVLSIAVSLVAIGCMTYYAHGPRDTWEGVVKKIRPATVKLIIGDVNPITEQEVILGSGSGFVINSNGLIATAAHVVEPLPDLWHPWLKVQFYNGDSYYAKRIMCSPEHDVAVIKIDAKDLPVLEFSEEPLCEGEPVLAMGSTGLSDWSVTDGIVSKVEMLYTDELGHGWLQMTTTLNPGYSGGPVVNASGKVVGISVAFFSRMNEVYIAAPGTAAKKIIKDLLRGRTVKIK